MKIENLKIKDCQRIKLFEITPDRNLVIIGGKNAQGKTSVLESIKMALAGKRGQVPKAVRLGAEQADIEILTDTGLKIKKTILPSGAEKLRITGPRDSNGQSLLNDLFDKHTIDPLAFTRIKKEEQRQTALRALGIDPSEIDRKIKDVYTERIDVNRDLQKLDSQLGAIPRYPDVSEEEVSMEQVAEQLRTANATIQMAESYKSKIQSLKEEKKRLQERLEQINKEGSALREVLNNIVVPNTDELKTKLTEIEDYNNKARANKTYRETEIKRNETSKESNRLTKVLEELRDEKKQLLASAQFPLPELSFDEEQILYKGVPFEQASGAEQLKISTLIGIALQPELKVLLIRDGSLLDDDNLKLLEEIADKHNAQIWLERVGESNEAAVIMEDGLVREDRTANGKANNPSNHAQH